MKAAVFNREGDLVTVVDLPGWLVVRLKAGMPILLPTRPQQFTSYIHDDSLDLSPMRVAAMRALNRTATALECDDDDTALLLEANFAPGQQHALNERERDAEGRGAKKLWDCLQAMGKARRGGE